jgi:hypothetical protein
MSSMTLPRAMKHASGEGPLLLLRHAVLNRARERL